MRLLMRMRDAETVADAYPDEEKPCSTPQQSSRPTHRRAPA